MAKRVAEDGELVTFARVDFHRDRGPVGVDTGFALVDATAPPMVFASDAVREAGEPRLNSTGGVKWGARFSRAKRPPMFRLPDPAVRCRAGTGRSKRNRALGRICRGRKAFYQYPQKTRPTIHRSSVDLARSIPSKDHHPAFIARDEEHCSPSPIGSSL